MVYAFYTERMQHMHASRVVEFTHTSILQHRDLAVECVYYTELCSPVTDAVIVVLGGYGGLLSPVRSSSTPPPPLRACVDVYWCQLCACVCECSHGADARTHTLKHTARQRSFAHLVFLGRRRKNSYNIH